MKASSLGLYLAALLLMSACGGRSGHDGAFRDEPSAYPAIPESYMTEHNEADMLDAPVFWDGPNGEHWIIAACKATDRLLVHDAVTGMFLRAVGVSGSGPGQFSRPNGIAVIEDLAIVVERDNHRLQAFRLPDWTVLGSFGDSALIKPYGIAVRRDSSGILLYVTDNYETPEEGTPPDEELGRRVKVFRMTAGERDVTAELVMTFGDTEGDGVLHIVESICLDTLRGRILLTDEDGESNDVKIYDFEGKFTDGILGSGVFRFQPEGIVLVECDDGNGYYVCVDQDVADNSFRVFDRATLEYLGAFRGVATNNSDGIAFTSRSSEGFPEGILAAVHGDGSLSTFDWKVIADTLGLKYRFRETAMEPVQP
ncbi:MAG: phytase precursor [Bacteroidetes bacterium]|nr:phytase precursor [Bacteroidota bacterium]